MASHVYYKNSAKLRGRAAILERLTQKLSCGWSRGLLMSVAAFRRPARDDKVSPDARTAKPAERDREALVMDGTRDGGHCGWFEHPLPRDAHWANPGERHWKRWSAARARGCVHRRRGADHVRQRAVSGRRAIGRFAYRQGTRKRVRGFVAPGGGSARERASDRPLRLGCL